MHKNKLHSKNAAVEPKLCCILGVFLRSGTNYIFRLIREHPDCTGPGPIWEDYFVHHSAMLKQFTNNVCKSWNPKWEVSKKIGSNDALLHHLGSAISQYLRLQITEDLEEDKPKVLLTKTPSVVGSENFFDLFPDDYLILVIRDGRSVIESGVKSFDWNYEVAMQIWKAGARAILDLKDKYQDSNKKLLIVKYEDLFMDETTELVRIFDFLGLDPKRYDFDRSKNLGVIGSSEIRKNADAVHWEAAEKGEDFNPVARFSHWDRKKHERFNWIAGRYMSSFGYDLEKTRSNQVLYVIRNRLYDFKWALRTILKTVKARVSGVKSQA